MSRAFGTRLSHSVRLLKSFWVVAYRAVVAYIAVVRPLGDVSAAVLETATHLVRAVPHHLGIVANHGWNVILLIAEGKIVVFQVPNLDGEEPGYLYVRYKYVLAAGPVFINPPARGVVVYQ